ncbi:MAG: DUF4058 family protein [Planctomycetaceae bacterium]|nr:DUF4058 family protein [Planctomycetaceae bacterium]
MIKHTLNHSILPEGYYAMAEQVAGGVIPDVLTLQAVDDVDDAPIADEEGGTAVAVEPPKVSITARLEQSLYARKANHLVIRHHSSDRVVAILEVISAGNKANRRDFGDLLKKTLDAIQSGIHVLLIDLHAPTSRDPEGLHGAIWAELGDDSYVAPKGKPLTLVSYVGHPDFTCYVEPTAVGQPLKAMPLFLTFDRYVTVPLEDSYMRAFAEIPDRARAPLERQS